MRYLPVDSPWGLNPGPEEIAIETWLDNTGPYLSLRESRDRVRPKPAALDRPGPAARTISLPSQG